MQVKSIAECSGAFCNTFDLHLAIIDLEIICYMKGLLYGGRFRQVILHMVDVAEQADQYLTRPQCTKTILSHF